MAGGRGERFWPVSREKMPKQLITLLGGTLLPATSGGSRAPARAAGEHPRDHQRGAGGGGAQTVAQTPRQKHRGPNRSGATPARRSRSARPLPGNAPPTRSWRCCRQTTLFQRRRSFSRCWRIHLTWRAGAGDGDDWHQADRAGDGLRLHSRGAGAARATRGQTVSDDFFQGGAVCGEAKF